jgi:hypothetical protein
MTIYTPFGMPISFPMDYAFTLLARLYPKYRPSKVLKIAEGMDKAPEAVACLLSFVVFSLNLSPIVLFISASVIPGIIYWMQVRSKFIELVVYLGIIFRMIGNFGIITIGLTLFGYYSSGWQGVAVFLSTRFLGLIVIYSFIDIQEIKRQVSLGGFKYNRYDMYFIDAYRFCANKIGVTLDLSVADQEIESDQWRAIYADYYQQNKILFEKYWNQFS